MNRLPNLYFLNVSESKSILLYYERVHVIKIKRDQVINLWFYGLQTTFLNLYSDTRLNRNWHLTIFRFDNKSKTICRPSMFKYLYVIGRNH